MAKIADENSFPITHRERKDLVIVRAGRDSLHSRWTEGEGPAPFDLLVAAYEDVTSRTDEWKILVPGSKVAGYCELFRKHPDLLEQYEYIALFDDDLVASRNDIARLFRIGRQYDLDLFQPSLSWSSYFSYAATLTTRSNLQLRYTNIVEMMCPVFSAKHLRRALPLFGLGYETGIDLIWTRLTNNGWFRYAIVDDVTVTHTRQVGTTKERQGFQREETYDRKANEVLRLAQAEFRGIVTYAAVDRRGQRIESRYLLGLLSLGLWAAWRKTPLSANHFARLVSDHTRHCFFRPINLNVVDVQALERASSSFNRRNSSKTSIEN